MIVHLIGHDDWYGGKAEGWIFRYGNALAKARVQELLPFATRKIPTWEALQTATGLTFDRAIIQESDVPDAEPEQNTWYAHDVILLHGDHGYRLHLSLRFGGDEHIGRSFGLAATEVIESWRWK